jgi:hypothetical protein
MPSNSNAKLNTPLLPQITNSEAIISTPLSVARLSLRDGQPQPHIEAMHLDLSDDEAAALIRELHDIIESDHYPFSPRIRTLRAILAKLRPEPAREPLPPSRWPLGTAPISIAALEDGDNI